jgi:hypothetical protein
MTAALLYINGRDLTTPPLRVQTPAHGSGTRTAFSSGAQ